MLSPVLEQTDHSVAGDSLSTSSQVVSTLVATTSAVTPTNFGDNASPIASAPPPLLSVETAPSGPQDVDDETDPQLSPSTAAALSPEALAAAEGAALSFQPHRNKNNNDHHHPPPPAPVVVALASSSSEHQQLLTPPSLAPSHTTASLQRSHEAASFSTQSSHHNGDNNPSQEEEAAIVNCSNQNNNRHSSLVVSNDVVATAGNATTSPEAVSSLGSNSSSGGGGGKPSSSAVPVVQAQSHASSNRSATTPVSPPRTRNNKDDDGSGVNSSSRPSLAVSPTSARVQSDVVRPPSPAATIVELAELISEDRLSPLSQPQQKPQESKPQQQQPKQATAASTAPSPPQLLPALDQFPDNIATNWKPLNVTSPLSTKEETWSAGPPTNITAPALNPSPVASPKEAGEGIADSTASPRLSHQAMAAGGISATISNSSPLVAVNDKGMAEEKSLTQSGVPASSPTATETVSVATTNGGSSATAAVLALATASLASSKAIRKKTTADIIRNDLWSSDLTTVLGALKHVTNEAGSDKARSIIARTGGLLAVVRAMDSHSTDSQVQVAGCQALEKLALDSDNEIAIEQVGGVDTILTAMMGHMMDASVQEAAWAALWNLTCTNASKDMPTLDAPGGMAAIVAAMREHMSSPAVQKNACGALANLCQNNPKRMDAFAKANGFGVIAMALQRYWNYNDDTDVRAEACFAMTALCEGSTNQLNAARTTALTTPAPPTSAAAYPMTHHHHHHATLIHTNGPPSSLTAGGGGGGGNMSRNYLPQRFTAANGGVPHSVLSSSLRPHLHYGGGGGTTNGSTRGNVMDSDLHSLASLSYFEEEVFDD